MTDNTDADTESDESDDESNAAGWVFALLVGGAVFFVTNDVQYASYGFGLSLLLNYV